MVINPNIVRLLYGTIVVATVATTGTLWYNRTGTKLVKTVDYVQLYQATLERTMATEYDDARTNVPTPAVFTNRIATWTPDSATWTYYQGSNAVSTNYWKLSGYTQAVVITNNFTNRTYVLKLPMYSYSANGERTRMHPLKGSLDQHKYIWNGYSNLVVTGAGNLNGTYTNNKVGLSEYIYDTAPVTYFWNCSTNWIVDRGPSMNCLLGSEYNLTTPEYYDPYTEELVDPITNALYTQNEDSALNGPWYTYDDTPIAVSVSGIDYAPNLLRDAFCHWYIDKGMQQTYASSHDPRYDYTGVGVIDAHVSDLDLIDLLFNDGEPPYLSDRFAVGPYYIWPFIATNVTASAISNYGDFGKYHVSIGSITNYAKVPVDEWTPGSFRYDIATLSNPPSTSNLTDIARYLHELKWTRAQGLAKWLNPGTKSNVVATNQYVAQSYWHPTWAAAKAAATTNFSLREINTDGNTPQTYTAGIYSPALGYSATILASEMELTYQGSCTDIVKDVCFWIKGQFVFSGLPNTTEIFDDFGLGINTNYYSEISVQSNSVDRFPYVTVGNTNYVWCDDPALSAGGYSKRGWMASGYPGIIQKWHFNYLTNAIP